MRTAFAFALVLMILLSGCSGQKSAIRENASAAGNQTPKTVGENYVPPAGNASTANTTPASPPNEQVVVQSPPPSQPTGPTQSLSVAMEDYKFNPANITVKRGTTVQLTITSIDRTYGFAIVGYNINEMVPAGNSSVVTFTADKSGTFGIKDSYVVSGAARNMVGTLTVTG